jgi:DNA-directed RNA polymerase sigma subunit (sigma70/sigma32)
VELQAEKHLKDKDKLLEHKARLQREIARIDNALTILKDEERDIIQMALIEQKKYALLEVKYNLTYGRIKQMEKEALKKIDKYLV